MSYFIEGDIFFKGVFFTGALFKPLKFLETRVKAIDTLQNLSYNLFQYACHEKDFSIIFKAWQCERYTSSIKLTLNFCYLIFNSGKLTKSFTNTLKIY